jgi:hypothetical protein
MSWKSICFGEWRKYALINKDIIYSVEQYLTCKTCFSLLHNVHVVECRNCVLMKDVRFTPASFKHNCGVCGGVNVCVQGLVHKDLNCYGGRFDIRVCESCFAIEHNNLKRNAIINHMISKMVNERSLPIRGINQLCFDMEKKKWIVLRDYHDLARGEYDTLPTDLYKEIYATHWGKLVIDRMRTDAPDVPLPL